MSIDRQGNGGMSSIAPILPLTLLRGVHALNKDFLHLVGQVPAFTAQRNFGLKPDLVQNLRELPALSRLQVCESSFSLFTLRLADAWFWRTAADGAVEDVASAEIKYADAGARSVFIIDALFFVWHLAHAAPLVGRLSFGMTDEVAGVLRALSLQQIRRFARSGEIPLAARWPDNQCFWPDLIRFAQPDTALELEATHLLGTQLLAAELAPAPQQPTAGNRHPVR